MQQLTRRIVAILGEVPGEGLQEVELSVRDPDGNPSEPRLLNDLFRQAQSIIASREVADFDSLFGLVKSGKRFFYAGSQIAHSYLS